MVLALASQIPASLRKADETKTMLLPSLIALLTEVETDDQVWAETSEEKESGSTAPYHTAVQAINRISVDLGEKTILPTCSSYIQHYIKSSDWKERQAGYMLMGLIAESSKESMKKNMDEAMRTACAGMVDENARVRYAGLSCLALLLTELSPKAQKKYHGELMPQLMKMMSTETVLKTQTHAVSATINFARGLANDEDEEEESADNEGSKIMSTYAQTLFENLVTLLKKGIDESYEPLQEEVMNLLSVVASLIEGKFAQFYNQMMPLMLQILNNVAMTNMT